MARVLMSLTPGIDPPLSRGDLVDAMEKVYRQGVARDRLDIAHGIALLSAELGITHALRVKLGLET